MSKTILSNPAHEGIQQALDLLHSRRSALNLMFADAQKRGDNNALFDLDIRHAEVTGLLSALRALMERAA